MYLKELRVNGFKSFADATRLEFHRGMTAIVGPNGCGKSNISDAIRWVLGEQSSKSLRAGNMEDVIFQGTTTRKPLNLCEVSLLFTDCEKELGTNYHEVEVARRVTRGGGSDYYLNGKVCRLRDIQRLFLDTGIGQVSYSFMLQGQIDKVISSNPSERRMIFEEAAGISRYKAQRREALTKLTGVDANLARVTDVMEEVSRQIGSLKRQAAKALRFRKVKHRLTHLELAASARKHTVFKTECTALEEQATGLRLRTANLRANLERREATVTEVRQQRTAINEQLAQAQQSVFDLRQAREQAQNQAELATQRVGDLERRIESIREEVVHLEARHAELVARAAGEAKNRQDQLSLFGDSDQVYQDKNQDLAGLSNKVSAAEADLQNRRQAILMIESTLTRLRSNSTTLEVDLKTYQVRHANLLDELHMLAQDSAVQESALQQLVATHAARATEQQESELQIKEAQADEVKAREGFRTIQQHIQLTDRELAKLQAQIGMLEQLQEKFEGFSDGAKAILKGQLGAVLPGDAYKVLTRYLKVEDPAHTTALETLLGPAIDTIALNEAEYAVPVAAELEAKKLGRTWLQIPVPGRSPQIRSDLPPWLVPAGSVITSDDERVAGLISNLLDGCFFVPALAEFLKYWEEHREFEFLLVATANGELVDRRGLILGGKAGKTSKDTSFLQRANDIKKLKKDLARLQKEMEDFRKQAAEAQQQLDLAGRTVEERRKRQMEVAQELSTVRAQEKSARATLDQVRSRLTSRENDLVGLDRNKDDSVKRLEKARHDLEKGEHDLAEARTAIANAEVKLNDLRNERDMARERFNEVRLEISEKKQRLAVLDRGLVEIERQKQETILSRNRRNMECDTLTEQIGQLREQSAREKNRSGEIQKTLDVTMQSLEQHKVALQQADARIKQAEDGLSSDRETLDRESTELNTRDLRLTRLRAEWDFLTSNIRREYTVDLDTIDWKRELWQAGDTLPDRMKVEIEDESPDVDATEQQRPEPTEENLASLDATDWPAVDEEVTNLRQRVNSMGPVNIGAIEEYKELRDRHNFLKTQSDDLWKAKEKLLAAIDEINKTSQELFANTFVQIRKNFMYTFEKLFGGGSADLQLIDTGDVLESGIEITARPPGTRLRNLGLLSGGQKTMTAVALLFAIYMVKPSPFCVLDEIDAPLDDANIGRFCDMLKQFLSYSQFLVITHNKRTISNSSTIYGATMQERGVTKVISMRFNPVTEQTETVA
ncbi:MAG: chromosome segregation protein SMC [Verrucomicrobiota bacterium]|nr:chromosome segregation protein SMC [Verrucomicrobiota bacterium]